MNNKKRARLSLARSRLEEAKSFVETVKDEEEDCLNNLPENLQEGDRYRMMEEAVDNLSEAIEHIDGAMDNIDQAQQ
ncbi:MAG: hypothetical protein E7655_02830 [Ruminococcaceae bacterium]|nr:hypothetical protein [Oscillospiraceae bacterium]